jgi:hypothetical protein
MEKSRMRVSFDEMVDEVFSWLEGEPQENFDVFVDTRKDELFKYHHTLGRSIRNTFELWSIEWVPELIGGVDYSPNHPDQISMRVIEEVWNRARKAYR